MRSLRTLTVAAGLLGISPLVAFGQSKTTPEDLLKFKPSLTGVEFENVTDPAAISACKVEAVTDAKKQQIGFALRDGQGKLLRRFLDTDGNRSLDQWSYYQDGFEVYRENDLNNDRSLDECRWLNSAGTAYTSRPCLMEVSRIHSTGNSMATASASSSPPSTTARPRPLPLVRVLGGAGSAAGPGTASSTESAITPPSAC